MSDEYPIARFLRLKTGDDIVSEVVEIEEDDKEYYLLIRPQKLVYISSKSGYVQLAFLPWVFPKICDHQEFTMDKNDVIITSCVSEKMNEYYWETVNDEDIPTEFGQEPDQSEDILQDVLEQLQNSKRTFH